MVSAGAVVYRYLSKQVGKRNPLLSDFNKLFTSQTTCRRAATDKYVLSDSRRKYVPAEEEPGARHDGLGAVHGQRQPATLRARRHAFTSLLLLQPRLHQRQPHIAGMSIEQLFYAVGMVNRRKTCLIIRDFLLRSMRYLVQLHGGTQVPLCTHLYVSRQNIYIILTFMVFE